MKLKKFERRALEIARELVAPRGGRVEIKPASGHTLLHLHIESQRRLVSLSSSPASIDNALREMARDIKRILRSL